MCGWQFLPACARESPCRAHSAMCVHTCRRSVHIPPCVYTHAAAACTFRRVCTHMPPLRAHSAVCVHKARAFSSNPKSKIPNPKSSIPNFARGRAFRLPARRLFTHAPVRIVRSRGTSSRGAGGCGPSGGGVFPRTRRGAAPAGRRRARHRAGRGRGRGGRR